MKNVLILFAFAFAFIACNKTQKSEVITLPITKEQYTLLKKGDGNKFNVGDNLKFSLLILGNNGDTIADRTDPSLWAMDKVAAVDSNTMPIVEMLYSLSLGDSVMMKVPLDSMQRPPQMADIDTLIYYIKITEVESQADQDKKMQELESKKESVATEVTDLLNKYKSGELTDLEKTEDGTSIYLVEKGTGNVVGNGENVSIDYYGLFEESGDMFDNSYERGQELSFSAGAGQMIKGMDQAILKLHHGDKAVLFIPYESAYGEAGRPPMIPEKANLVFYVDVK
ncbi:MAG: FKBP-type peptidyl-prolyl cis-trans isomerase [Saprospiraceae bacterium]